MQRTSNIKGISIVGNYHYFFSRFDRNIAILDLIWEETEKIK